MTIPRLRAWFRALSLLVALATSAAAQGVRIAPLVGVTSPQAGTMITWERLPAAAGTDSVPWAHRYQPGIIVGVTMDLDRPGRLDWSAQITGTFSERRIESPSGNERPCECTSSVILSAGLMARRTFPLRGSVRLVLGLGPEVHYFGGEAVSNEDAFTPEYYVEVSPRTAVGGLGSVGLEADLHRRFSLRFQGGYRYIAIKHRGVSPSLWPTVSFQEEAKQDLIFSVGIVLRAPVER